MDVMELFFNETRMQANLEPMTHSHPSLYVNATYAFEKKRTCVYTPRRLQWIVI